MSNSSIEDRVTAILHAIVESYIHSPEPVGSRTLSKRVELGLSPATIRNVMADLTEQGYLEQPHTSAGRIPTEKAYRHYVDATMDGARLAPAIKLVIDESILESGASLEKLLEGATNILAELTQLTGVASPPKVNITRLRMIEFLKISKSQIFVLLITQSNMVFNKMIEVTEDLTQEFLNSVSGYLNRQFSEKSLQDIRSQVLESLVEEKEQYDQLLAHVVRLSKKAFEFTEERPLYVDGQFNILRGISSIDSAQRLMVALEEKISLLNLMDKALTHFGVRAYIGEECEVEDLKDFSMVTANYGNRSNVLGSLGVIGPTRMDYLRIIPIIGYTAKTVSQALSTQ